MKRLTAGSFLLACVLVGNVTTAQEFVPSVSVWVGHTDNPLAIYHPQDSAYYSDLNAGFSYTHQSKRSDIEADLRVVRRDYFGTDIGGSTLPSGRAEISYDFIQDRLSWVLEDTVGQVSARPYEALSNPDRATLNVFTTGPDLQLTLGERGYLLAEGRAGRSQFNQMNIDSADYSGGLTIGRELSPRAKLGVIVAARTTDYGRNGGGRNDFQDVYISLSMVGARTELDVAGGAIAVDTTGSRRRSSPSFRMTLTREASPRAVIGLDYFRGFSESVQAFVRDSTTGTGAAGEAALDITAAPFLSETYRLDFVKGEGRFDVGARIGYSKENYAGEQSAPPTGDRRALDGEIALEYQLSSKVQFVTDFQATRYRTLGTQIRPASTQQAWSGTAGVVGQVSRSLGVGVLFLYSKGDADLSRTRSFIERRFIAGLIYEPRAKSPRLYDPMRNFRRFQAQVTAKLPKNRIPAP